MVCNPKRTSSNKIRNYQKSNNEYFTKIKNVVIKQLQLHIIMCY